MNFIYRTISGQSLCNSLNAILIALVGSMLSVSSLSHAQNSEMHEHLFFEVEDLRDDQESGLLIDSVHFFLHDGTFDLFDFGKHASEGLRWFANHGKTDKLKEELDATDFEFARHWEVVLNIPGYIGSSPSVRPGNPGFPPSPGPC